MNPRRLLAIIRKEIRHITLDPGVFFLSVFAPALLLLLLGYVFSFEVSRIDLLVINGDQSPLSAEYLRYLTADGTVRLVDEAADDQAAIEAFRAGEADAALVIPPGFAASFNSRENSPVGLIVDASDAGMAHSVISEVETRSSRFSTELLGGATAPFTVIPRYFFNPNLDSTNSMIPGLLPMVLIPSIMAIALSITREMETGTFETLITTPVKGLEFLGGKLIVHLGLGVLGAYLALAVAVFWFMIPFRGSAMLFGLAALIYLFAMMSICFFLTRFIRNQRAVTTVILLIFFAPSFFLTDLIAPIDPGSGVSYLASRALPTTYFIDITRGIALKGVILSDIQPDLATLMIIGLLFLALGFITFEKKLV